ncbi:MAG TPA: HAMP domain-containing sensor histidine kinase, partial [Nitrososphaeraceae archaeon]|nr:HAMP domain-containing sensor histidine kinase [Nitrososphaeraceae archaeon]
TQAEKDTLPSNQDQERTKYERTEMLIGPEVTTKQAWEFFSNVSKKVDGCASSAATPIVITVFKDAYKDMKRRGIKIRSVTDITKENLKHCKDLMQYAEVRHISHLIGNFGISETEYILAPTMKEGQPLPKLIYSNSKEMVEQQQNIFDIFWSKAIPAEQRIKEVEEDREEEFFQVINNPEIAMEIYVNLAKSVKSSALLLLPSSKALIIEYKLGVLDHLLQASKNKHSQDIRIICSIDDNNAQIIRWLYEEAPNIKIMNNRINLATKLFIVNDDTLFRAELPDPEADTFSKAFGFAIYSNSKPTVGALKSLFELVWHSYETNEKLQEADKVQREFINIAAHELRTPIVPILNLSELLYSNVKEPQLQQGEARGEQQEKEMLEIILRNANRLHQLTEDILDVTRIESHTLKLRKERFNLNDVMLDVIEDYRKQIDANRNVKLMYEQGNDNTLVEADRRRLTQVISNLLSNAIKFTQEGAVTVTTTTTKERNDEGDGAAGGGKAEEVVVSIKDTGTGIDPELMPRLFTKFATKSYQGTGLGLFISKSIIEAHGGKMWAENNNNNNSSNNRKQEGATFYFTLPVMN